MKKGFFEKPIELRFCDCDYKKRAKIATLMAVMADMAGVAYAHKGYSHSWLWENNFVFLLSKVSVHINRIPVADECLTVQTWERDIKGVQFFRDFNITDIADKVCVEASTSWVLVNPLTRHIIRPSEFTGTPELNPEVKANVTLVNKIKCPHEFIEVGERKIVFSDIDANGHVYNAIYVAIACDFLPTEFMEKTITDFQINFKQEATLGQHLTIKTKIVENTGYIIGIVDDNLSFEVKIVTE